MKHNILKNSICLFLLVGNFTLARGEINSASSANNLQATAQFYLSFPKTTFTNGEAIVGCGVLTNIADSPMNVPVAHMNVGVGLVVTDTNGLMLSQSNAAHGYFISGPMAVVLPAHDCITSPFELDKLYNLKPGSYLISAHREMSFGDPSGSNTLAAPVTKITVENAP